MAEKFDLGAFSSKLIGTPKYQGQKKADLRLIKKTQDYKRRLWMSFYFALTSTSIFTAVFIEQTNLAGIIMARARAARSGQASSQVIDDYSSFSITTDPGLFALITTPSGFKAGDTYDDIRFTEAPNIEMTKHRNLTSTSTVNWSLVADKPETGAYNIQFATKSSGTYNYTVIVYDIRGVRHTISGSISLDTNTPSIYIFEYDQDTSTKSRLYQSM